MKCRHCSTDLKHVFLDLGFAPYSNSYLKVEGLNSPEQYFPLRLLVCHSCWLVQTDIFNDAGKLFDADYAYFSSISSSWLNHAKKYCDDITHRLGISKKSFVIEIASNDGYLLKNFVDKNIPCLGIEPTASTASAAEAIGIPVIREFFGEGLAHKLVEGEQKADLIIGNNVYAHVPDINDFTKGMKIALKQGGTITLEFPHLLNLIDKNQFDTVYHEHFSYLSLTSVTKIFDSVGLRIYDVEKLPTHGGSLRVYGCHANDQKNVSLSVHEILTEEDDIGLKSLEKYESFQKKANKVKNDFIKFLVSAYDKGETVAAYGAAAKGNTLLNYAGVKKDLLSFVCDAAPSKQGKLLPGSHIPIVAPSALKELKPDWVVIFPWNIADEVIEQHKYISSWGGKFVTFIPDFKIIERI